ncbi:alpha/beta fold hydrolase [Dokdonella sp.]|uniref:esterase/lipase family protein n=1 Tax=Dokdonella sp. TaxID=2291710 RepID=UPI0031F2DF04
MKSGGRSAKSAALRSAPSARMRRDPRAASAPSREHVILLHGIWMRGLTLAYLSRHLRHAGYSVETMDYASVFTGFAPAVEQLRARLRSLEAPAVHLVGHSLGGLVALEAIRGVRGLPRGRVVGLGSPLRGSAVARGLAAIPGGRWLMGHSVEPLLDGLDDWSGSRKVGVIAGKLPFGLGFALGTLSAPHDGTVAVAETQLPGIADHCTVSASHTGMLLSHEVADLVVEFLRHGRFESQPQ